MYLSRLQLKNNHKFNSNKEINLRDYHAWVETAFPEEIEKGIRSRKLWRIDRIANEDYLLIVSKDKPDLTLLESHGVPGTAKTLNYDILLDSLKVGQRLQFKTTLTPTKSVFTGDSEQTRGRVISLTNEDDQKTYLVDRGEKNGFSLNPDDFMITSAKYGLKKKIKGNDYHAYLVTYDGYLTVTDVDKFKNLLIKGLGKNKAYGCGLMTVI